MASSREYRDYVLEQLNILNGVTWKSMMGEYLLYYNGILFGGVYDDRLLVKKVEDNKKYNLEEVSPYPNAKNMYLVDIDDQETLCRIVLDTCNGLRK